ncbi:putative protein kinase [Blattamonas nauphoetae]|uniref:Uncharacterized protein n=1 Tax=Blattamonas nauphoetae TaxID=2049346 RepID=A0ABQ9Y449_9EUKA|nr:putative protein kinase [Blattamonas nauphoetae]
MDLRPQANSPVPDSLPHDLTSNPDHTIIFFDWDDTLMASNVLCMNGVGLQTPLVPKHIIADFISLQDRVISLLKCAARFTKNVFIVTNGEYGWVELSCQKFMPRVYDYLKFFPVISARTTYQNTFPDKPNMWKKTTFIERINFCFPPSTPHQPNTRYNPPIGPPDLNAISLGDSESERDALISLQSVCHTNALLKSIKFVERPSTEQLKRQLEMVESNFPFIVRHNAPLDLMLQISTCQQPPEEEGMLRDEEEPNMRQNTTQVGGDKEYRSLDGRINGPPRPN